MPIKSYLAHPIKDKMDVLMEKLSKIEACELVPSKNEELIIVVTETIDEEAEQKLQQQLEAIEEIQLLSLVSGFNSPQKQ
ncbi:MAG: hypothetical protein ACPGSD_06480 [Flavobacteriales bacterium]